MLKVYLAGPIEQVSEEDASQWRVDIGRMMEYHGLRPVNPLRLYSEDLGSSSLITRRDRFLCEKSDMVLFRLFKNEQSVGTKIEIGQFDIMRKPIFIWHDGNPIVNDHPMIWDMCTYASDNVLHLIKIMKDFIP